MQTFECQVCGHIAFEQAPVNCCVCSSSIESFENNPDAVKTALDPENLTESERKHVPKISLRNDCTAGHEGDCTVVQVQVGEVEHVMESEHYINFIDLYINRKHLSRVVLTAKNNHPVATLHITHTKGTLSVIAHCNVHGNWRSKLKLKSSG